MRTEQQLRDALHLLAEASPAPDDVLKRFHRPTTPPRSPRRWRPALVILGLGLALVLIGVVVVPQLTRQAAPEPADRRVVGRWGMVSHLDPPLGWKVEGRVVAGTFETTTITDATGKGYCEVEVDGRGVAPQHPALPTAEPAVVAGRQALYEATPAGSVALYWHYTPNAWASVTCVTGPHGLGAAQTAQQIRGLLAALATSVTFGEYPVRVPLRIAQLPAGYRVATINDDDFNTPSAWSITLEPTRVTSTTPVINLGPSYGRIPDPNTRVPNYPASFSTERLHSPMTSVPPTTLSVTSLCIPSAPVGTCVSAANTDTDDPESRRGLFYDIAEHITYATSAADKTTWFDATAALPT